MGLNKTKWYEQFTAVYDFEILHELSDDFLQRLAFTEKEAQDFTQKYAHEKGFGEIKLEFTYEKELEKFRKALKDCGLTVLFRD